jgi:hypothetical protein
MQKYPPNRLIIDWISTVLIIWFYAGLFIDIWGHNHLKVSELESFFTPSHFLFYSGFAAIAFFYLVLSFFYHQKGYRWLNSLPKGYSLIYLLLFAAGGVVDFIWHSLFGVEKNLDALISPSHLFLGIGTSLILLAPARSGWLQEETKRNIFSQLPLLISLVTIWTCYSVVTEFAHPIFQPILSGVIFPRQSSQIFNAQGLGVASIYLQTILMMSILYLNIFRWKFVPGGITFLFSINAILMTMMASKTLSIDYNFLTGGLIAGVLTDFLYYFIRPSINNPLRLQIFSFTVPLVYNSCYFLSLYLGKGFWTSIHLTTGVIIESAIIIWFYSLIIISAVQTYHPSKKN